MNDEDVEERINEQIERCRLIASMMVDDKIRHSLERLADEYEARLPEGSAAFMLRSSEEEGDAR